MLKGSGAFVMVPRLSPTFSKVFCYKSDPDFWGFPGGLAKPLEAYDDALKRMITQDCDFPEPMRNWIKRALSRPMSGNLTHLTENAHPDFKPNGRTHHHYTI
jgi:hypothetical protein